MKNCDEVFNAPIVESIYDHMLFRFIYEPLDKLGTGEGLQIHHFLPSGLQILAESLDVQCVALRTNTVAKGT